MGDNICYISALQDVAAESHVPMAVVNRFRLHIDVEDTRKVWETVASWGFVSVAKGTVYVLGPGISKGELKKIFQRGYSNKGAGHGFGLYLVKHSIENLDGTISVESAPGEGTIFTVRLPVKKRGETNV